MDGALGQKALRADAEYRHHFREDKLGDRLLPVDPLTKLLCGNPQQAGAKLRAETRRLNHLLEHLIVLEV
jgi:hypothetical protein